MKNTAAIQSTIDTMVAAFQAGDIDGVLATYEPGGAVVAQPGGVLTGPALREMFAGFIAMNPTFTFPRHEVFEVDDIAMHISTWDMQGLGPDGKPVKQGGLSVVVLRRQPDGQWLMVLDNPTANALLDNEQASIPPRHLCVGKNTLG